MSDILAFAVPFLLLVIAGSLTWQGWRMLRDSVAWHVEQRLYGVRGKLYDRVRAGELSFEDENVLRLADFLHSGVDITRSRYLRRLALRALTAPDEPTDEQCRERIPFMYDKRLRVLSLEATWHMHKCLVVELFSRYFWAIIPAALLLCGAAVSRKASQFAMNLSRQYSMPLAMARC